MSLECIWFDVFYFKPFVILMDPKFWTEENEITLRTIQNLTSGDDQYHRFLIGYKLHEN